MRTKSSSPARTVLHVVLFLIGTMVVFAASSGFTPASLGAARDIVSIGTAAAATFALTALFVRWDGITLSGVGASLSAGSLPRVSIGFAIGAVMIGIDLAALHFGGQVQWHRTGQQSFGHIALYFILFLVVALREELAYRSYPLRRLEAAFGPWIAQFAIAAIFALEHFGAGYSWSNALFGTCAGALLFGTAALITRGLAVPIGIHLAWNFGDWMMGNKDMSGPWQPVAPTTQIIGLSAYLFAVAIGMLLLFVLRNRFRSQA